VRRRGQAAALVLAAVALGCPRKQEEPAPPEAGTAPAQGASTQRAGVKVPLPPGWTAQVAADGSFQAGPLGHPVLRVDIRPGQGAALPSDEALLRSLREPFRDFELSVQQQESSEHLTVLQVRLAPRLEDGGVGPESSALLGARRAGGDLFLCASLPGASEEEVRLAAEACRAIELQAPPR
jgi:hypothetical protein